MADIIVVGGGAAGLFCAGWAAKAGQRVAVIEHGKKPGQKLLITGKGRCNVTNDCDETAFFQQVRRNPRFVMSCIHMFPPARTIAFFEEAGVPLKTERGRRVFPQSDRAADIVNALIRFADTNHVQFLYDDVKSLLVNDGAVTGVACASGQMYQGTKVVICTGGLSYPGTGSDGSGYKLAQEAGHRVITPSPSLVPIVTEEAWCRELMGLSLKNVTLTLWQKDKPKPVFQELGEMLFTHFGVSGPLVLSASSHMEHDPKQYRMTLDLKPGLTAEQLDARLLRDFGQYANKNFANALDDLLPRKLIPVMVALCGIVPEQKVHQVTKEERRKLVELLKALPIYPKKFRPIAEAVITSGGVDVKEVNPKTMQSKLVRDLYFAGEILDIDAYTGGYNLQLAFATAYAAAQAAAEGRN